MSVQRFSRVASFEKRHSQRVERLRSLPVPRSVSPALAFVIGFRKFNKNTRQPSTESFKKLTVASNEVTHTAQRLIIFIFITFLEKSQTYGYYTLNILFQMPIIIFHM